MDGFPRGNRENYCRMQRISMWKGGAMEKLVYLITMTIVAVWIAAKLFN